RIVAVGNLHGDLESALSVLRMAHVIDSDGKWAGGSNTVLVQTGDIIDYGPDTKELLMLFPRLVQEANRAGGRVIQLLGNHEVMNMIGDLRYVRERPDEFLSPESRTTTFSSTGYLGSRLFNLPLVHRVGDTIFAHGSITETWAQMGIQTINSQAKYELGILSKNPGSASSAMYPLLLGKSSPVRHVGYAESAQDAACKVVRRILDIVGAKRLVTSSTLMFRGKIRARCDGALTSINTGISRFVWERPSALEI
ncbi:Metallo-dependent phosphatase-like protein, partial [Thamnocephalis sphaerospora]